jgi:chromosomal replication initiation ATPase DnaA
MKVVAKHKPTALKIRHVSFTLLKNGTRNMDRLEIATRIYCAHHESITIETSFKLADALISYNDEFPSGLSGPGGIGKLELFIESSICKYFGIRKSDLNNLYRGSEIVMTRYFLYFWMKFFFTKMAYKELAKRFGDRDHATAMHGIKQISRLHNTHPEYKKAFEYFVAEFKPDPDRLKTFIEKKSK